MKGYVGPAGKNGHLRLCESKFNPKKRKLHEEIRELIEYMRELVKTGDPWVIDQLKKSIAQVRLGLRLGKQGFKIRYVKHLLVIENDQKSCKGK